MISQRLRPLRSHIRLYTFIQPHGVGKLIAQKIELNVTLLQPFIIGFILESEFKSLVDDSTHHDTRKFTASHMWIKKQLRDQNLSYRSITNDAGKVPTNWKESRDVFLIRIAYVLFMFQIPPCKLTINMDETPLMHTASTGQTWADINTDNVAIQGALDKRQHTGTPWINTAGEIFFFISQQKERRLCVCLTLIFAIKRNSPVKMVHHKYYSDSVRIIG